jgi:hypothetical protein
MDDETQRPIEWQGQARLDQAGTTRLVELLAVGLERLLLAQSSSSASPSDAVDFAPELCVYTDHGSANGGDFHA